jgi:hypothetical protein
VSQLFFERGGFGSQTGLAVAGAVCQQIVARYQELQIHPLQPLQRVAIGIDGELVRLLIAVDLADAVAFRNQIRQPLLGIVRERVDQLAALLQGIALIKAQVLRIHYFLESRVGGQRKKVGCFQSGAEEPNRRIEKSQESESDQPQNVRRHLTQSGQVHAAEESSFDVSKHYHLPDYQTELFSGRIASVANW